MNVYYVTYPSKVPWCSDFTAANLAKHCKHTVIPYNKKNLHNIKDSIIHIHNVQILTRQWLPIHTLKRIHKNNNKIIAGLRGNNGYHKYDHLLRRCDAISVGIDPQLKQYAEQLNQKVYVLPPGENPDLFKPIKTMKTSTLCWVGRNHKKFKHANLITKLGYSYRLATYQNYTPHHELPIFYNQARTLVGFSDYEGFWRPCLEAALCGIPVLTTPVGVAPYILDPECLIPHPAADNIREYQARIQHLVDDPGLGEYIGALNREKALRYSWANVAPLYDEAWSNLYEA